MTRDWDLRADELSSQAIADGEPTAWFDRLYAEGAAGDIGMPWSRDTPSPQLSRWYSRAPRTPGRAVVVGCGLGADAEFLAEQGWAATGFDVAPTAIEQARARHTDSAVTYRVADLLDLDPALVGQFDLVVEIFTLQALPPEVRPQAAAAVASLVAPGGTLLAVAFGDDAPQPSHPPYPLTRADLALLEVDGVRLESAELADERWTAQYGKQS